MNPDEIDALFMGLQAMAIVAGVFINILGWVVGADYYLAGLPFLLFSMLGWPIFRVLKHAQK